MDTAKGKSHWFRFTPGWLLAVLLAVEGLPWLSEQFRWLPKGWPVLITIAPTEE
jgi:hypothetical protein